MPAAASTSASVATRRTARQPSEGRYSQKIELDRAVGAAVVDQLGEVGGAAIGGGEVGAGGDGAALAAAAAEVDRHEGEAVGGGQGLRRWRQGAGEPRQRPAVGGDERRRDDTRPGGGARRRSAARSRRARSRPAETSPPPATAAITATRIAAISAASPALSIVAWPPSAEPRGSSRRPLRVDRRTRPVRFRPSPLHAADARAEMRAGGAHGVPIAGRRCAGSA